MIKEKVAIGLVNSRRLKSILRIWNVNLRRNYSDMVKQWKSSKKIILATSVVFCWCNCIDLLAIDYEAVSVMHFTNTYRSCKWKAFCKTLAMTVTVTTRISLVFKYTAHQNVYG
jgi:hypothetical protein